MALYARSRRLPTAIAVSVAATALTWTGWSLFSDAPEINQSLVILTVLLALSAFIPTLAGDDDALESTAARPWPPRRAAHLLAAAVVVAVPLLAGHATGASFGPAGELLRDIAGLTGLIGLGTALAGTRMAWQLPVCWTVAQMLFASSTAPALFWLVQPAGNVPAAVTAAGLFGAGLLTYAWRVGPRRAPAEAVLGQ